MPSLRSAYITLELGLQGTSTGVRQAVVPVNGTVREVWVGAQVLMTAGNVAVAKGSTNLLSGTNVNLAASGGDLTAGVGQSIALATAPTTRRVTAGNVISATWTATTAGSFTGGSCIVVIEPDTW